MDYIIGIDIGTTSTKAIAFDLNGKIIAKKNIEYEILNPEPTYSEQNPEDIFGAVINSLKYITSENVLKNQKLLGVSFSCAMHSIIALDDKGQPLTNCIIWADTRSKDYASKIKNSDVGHEIYMKTGTPIHPMSPLPKLVWMKNNMLDTFNNTYKFLSIKGYIFYKLFGSFLEDYSLASATGLFDIYDLKWNKKALEIAGIDESKLGEAVPTTYITKGLVNGYSDFIGIDKDTPFIIGGSDGCLANLGTNAINPGNAAVTIGTSGAIRVISDKPKNDEKERIFSYILDEEHYVLGGPVNNGGIILRWFRDNFSPLEVQAAKEMGIDPYVLMTEKALGVTAGSEGLIFLPYLLGERAPNWDADSKGVFFGINIKHTRDHFIRAVMEGIIFGIYDVSQALEDTVGNIDTIYATGGFVRSKLWVQILSDVCNKRVVITESYENSCLGAAVIGFKALGIIKDLSEVEKLIPISREFLPDPKAHETYAKTFKIYKRLYELLKDEFVGINELQ